MLNHVSLCIIYIIVVLIYCSVDFFAAGKAYVSLLVFIVLRTLMDRHWYSEEI